MAARKCPLCPFHYPTGQEYVHCQIHNEPTVYRHDADPEENWWDQYRTLRQRYAEDAEEKDLIPTIEAAVHEEGGITWLSMWDVQTALGHRLQEGYLVRVGDTVYEILGYVEHRREYVVQPFSLELLAEELKEILGD